MVTRGTAHKHLTAGYASVLCHWHKVKNRRKKRNLKQRSLFVNCNWNINYLQWNTVCGRQQSLQCNENIGRHCPCRRCHHTCAKETGSILLQWLSPCGTDPHHYEVLWMASHVSHQVHPPPHPGPLSHTGPNVPQRTQSALLSTQPSPTWKKQTHM